MMYDGRQYRRNRFLGWRPARGGDTYVDGSITHKNGEEIPSFYVVVFRIKDAPTGHHAGREVYYPNQVASDKLLPVVGHTATNVALGKIKRCVGQPLRDVRYNVGMMAGHIVYTGYQYIEQPHYLVKDGQVYQWTSRRAADREDI